jgi:DNA-binding GntR family transcriptional regulator
LTRGAPGRAPVLSSHQPPAAAWRGERARNPARSAVPAPSTRKKLRSAAPEPRSAPPAAASSLADQAYFLVEEMIMAGKVPPNSFLSESGLSEQLGIGRTPVREALKRLEADGMLEVIPSRGIRLAEVDLKQHLMVLEVRRQLERLVAVRAARYATPAERKQFEDLARRMNKAAASADGEAFMRTDQEFNVLLDTVARNPIATRAMRPLRAMSRRFWFRNFPEQRDSLEMGAKTHTAVMVAVAAGDAKAAGEAMDALMDYVEGFARSTLNL